MTRLRREVEALRKAVELDLRPAARTAMTPTERRGLRSEIEICMQLLDELRTRLAD